ncbi:hypothetical protein OF83DRAFT_1172686 [Amylostereum chailletii]|nr:hypothetical protein OF83DRAFT_1172686 [Amylostereum chailletii]
MSAGNISSASALSSSRSHVTLSHVRRLSPRSSFNAAATRIRSSRFCRQKRSSLGLEALAFGLEALKESADPCTPLKAAVGGLLCFVNRDMVAAAEDAQRIIQRIEQLEDTMMNAVPEDPSTIASS